MPKAKLDSRIITTRLDKESHSKFMIAVAESGQTQTEVARDAILFYLEYKDQVKGTDAETRYIAALKKSTNRICSLLSKTALDVSTLAHFVFDNVDEYGKGQIKEAYQKATRRVRSSLSPVEKEISGMLSDGDK